MKKILIIIILSLSFINGEAQPPIEPIYSNFDYAGTEGAYYKDTHNDYDRFVGTWQHTNGNTSLTITLVKKEMQYIDNSSSTMAGPSYFEDILVGEYRYVENGVEKVNTLPNLQISYSDPYEYNLSGGIIEKYNPSAPASYCLGCNAGEVKVALNFSEPNVNIKGSSMFYYFRHFKENGIEKLELTMFNHGMMTYEVGSVSINNTYSIPEQDYILIKQ